MEQNVTLAPAIKGMNVSPSEADLGVRSSPHLKYLCLDLKKKGGGGLTLFLKYAAFPLH